MANQYRTLTRDIAASLRSQNVDAAAASVALDAFAQALPDGKLKASLGEPGSDQRAAAVEAVEAHLAEEDDGDDLGADDDTLSALASVAAEAAFAKDAVALGKCCRDAAQTLGDAEIPLLDRSDGDGVVVCSYNRRVAQKTSRSSMGLSDVSSYCCGVALRYASYRSAAITYETYLRPRPAVCRTRLF